VACENVSGFQRRIGDIFGQTRYGRAGGDSLRSVRSCWQHIGPSASSVANKVSALAGLENMVAIVYEDSDGWLKYAGLRFGFEIKVLVTLIAEVWFGQKAEIPWRRLHFLATLRAA